MTNNISENQSDPVRPSEPEHVEITTEMIDHYVDYAHKLRSAMIVAALSRMWSSIASLWTKADAKPVAPVETVANRFANSLTAIRTSAEMLRDVDDLTEEERARFVRTVLTEELRLEKMLADITNSQRSNVPVT